MHRCVMSKDWRIELLARYPRLFGAGLPEPNRARPHVLDGWRELLESTVARIAAVRDTHDAGEFLITEIYEKYGSLRIDYSANHAHHVAIDRIENILTLSEAISERTCETCGSSGRLYEGDGTLRARCALHAVGQPVTDKSGA